MKKKFLGWGAGVVAGALLASPAQAAVSAEAAYVFNSFSFLVCGALVMFMAAGFAMLESGLVRARNTAAICLKNIALYSIAGLMFYLIGYDLMYTGVDGGVIGSLLLLYNPSELELALINADEKGQDAALAALMKAEPGYSSMSDWFFQMVFVATAASIVSGALAERIKVWPFLVFVVVLTGVIYPVIGALDLGLGLACRDGLLGFRGLHHRPLDRRLGGACGRADPRRAQRQVRAERPDQPRCPVPTSRWLRSAPSSSGSGGSVSTAARSSRSAPRSTRPRCRSSSSTPTSPPPPGVVAAMALTQILYRKIDLTLTLNGAIGGLVAITAGPDLQNHLLAIVVGGIGGALVVFAVPLLDKLRIDDVVGAIPAHLVAGIWGTLAVGIFGSGDFLVQLIGVVAVGAFVHGRLGRGLVRHPRRHGPQDRRGRRTRGARPGRTRHRGLCRVRQGVAVDRVVRARAGVGLRRRRRGTRRRCPGRRLRRTHSTRCPPGRRPRPRRCSRPRRGPRTTPPTPVIEMRAGQQRSKLLDVTQRDRLERPAAEPGEPVAAHRLGVWSRRRRRRWEWC